MLNIYYYCVNKFKDFSIFLVYNNLFVLLEKIEKEFLMPKKIAKLC